MNFFRKPTEWLHYKKSGTIMTSAERVRRLKRIDRLAVDRTLLANERTLLAYVRTSISLTLLGVALIQLFKQPGTSRLGVICFAAAAGFLFYGVIRGETMRKRIENRDDDEDN